MSESKRTPGPWIFRRWHDAAKTIPRLGNDGEAFITAGDVRIARVDLQRRDVSKRKLAEADDPERDANAEFIVRACNSFDNLLAACKDLLAEFNRYDEAMTAIGRGHEDYGGKRAAARAAIADATETHR